MALTTKPAVAIPRDPTADVRTRRALDALSALLTEERQRGLLMPLSGVGAPASTDGAPGSIYFDITDPNDPLFWYKT